jgi:hypothetical protein
VDPCRGVDTCEKVPDREPFQKRGHVCRSSVRKIMYISGMPAEKVLYDILFVMNVDCDPRGRGRGLELLRAVVR